MTIFSPFGAALREWGFAVLTTAAAELISSCGEIQPCYSSNQTGNGFWNAEHWEKREDLNYYNLSLNDNNI